MRTGRGDYDFGLRRHTRRVVGVDVDQPEEYAAAELHKLGSNPLAAPALESGPTESPARG